MLAILASAVAIVIASFVAGRAFLFALGRTRPTWLSGAVGFAVLVVVCPLLIHLPGRATTATILTILALLISLAAMRSRFFAQKTNISEEVSEEPDAGASGAQGAGVSGVAPDGHPQHGREDGAMHGSESDRRGSPPAIQPVPPTGSQAPSAAHATALATVLITLLLACLPFLLNNSTGVLGEGIYTNDQAAQLYWTDWLQNGDGPEPSAVRFGYPTGPQSLTAVAAEATGASLEHAFDGLLVAIAILGALAALSVLGELEPRRRVAAAVVTGLPYLGASFLAQSAFKETAMGLLVLALAIVLVEIARGDVPRRAGIGALLALAAASVFTYSLPGLIWFAAAIPLWIVFELLRGSGRVRADLAAGADAIRSHRRLLLLGLAAVVVVAVLGAGPVRHFFSKISSVQSSPGRLGSPISPGEVFGVWPAGDFRLVRGAVSGAIPAAAIGLLAVGFGALFAFRRRQNGLLAVLVAGAVVYVGTRIDASIYVQAKALAVIAPTVALAAFAGLLAPAPQAPDRGGRRRARLLLALGIVFTVGALGSTLLALRAAPVGFDNRAHDLEKLAGQIQGKRVVFLGLDRFAAYWLRGTLIEAPGGYVPPSVKARKDKPWLQGRPVDFDTMSPERLDDFRYAITTTAGFQSQPPPNMTMVDTVGSYELWKRKGRTPPQRVLDEGSSSGVKLDCNTPAASDLSIQDGSATVLPEPVVGDLTSWSRSSPFGAPGSASQKLVLRPGHWQLSLQYASQVSLDVTGPHLQRALPPSLDGMYFTHPGEGEFWDAGALTVKRRGPVTITVSASQPPLLSRLAGAHRRVWLGTLAATRVAATHTLPLKQSCGQYVDHYTLNAAER